MPTQTAEIKSATEPQKRISPRSRQIGLALREQCEALYKAGWMPLAISRQTGVNRMTIFQWAKRYGWTESRDKIMLATGKGVAATIAEKLAQRSEELVVDVTPQEPKPAAKPTSQRAAVASPAREIRSKWLQGFASD